MKFIASFFLLFFSTVAAHAQDIAPIMNASISGEKLEVSIFNDSHVNKQCSVNFKVSLLDDSFLVKGFRDIKFNHYILSARNQYRFVFDLKNMLLEEKGLILGEITEASPLVCQTFSGSLTEVKNAVEGALRNSDLATAQDFLELAAERSEITVIDVSHSFFNEPLALETLGLNHIEMENTTYLLTGLSSEEKQCSTRKSLKCGKIFKEKASAACGVESYNMREHKICGCKTRKGGPCMGGCSCKTHYTCAHPSFGVRSYKTCRHESHGLFDVKSCELEVTKEGELKLCNNQG
ncbi:MAG: hypothetical protein WCY48_07190 [Candidatus Caldatribacteriota bacterium]